MLILWLFLLSLWLLCKGLLEAVSTFRLFSLWQAAILTFPQSAALFIVVTRSFYAHKNIKKKNDNNPGNCNFIFPSAVQYFLRHTPSGRTKWKREVSPLTVVLLKPADNTQRLLMAQTPLCTWRSGTLPPKSEPGPAPSDPRPRWFPR